MPYELSPEEKAHLDALYGDDEDLLIDYEDLASDLAPYERGGVEQREDEAYVVEGEVGGFGFDLEDELVEEAEEDEEVGEVEEVEEDVEVFEEEVGEGMDVDVEIPAEEQRELIQVEDGYQGCSDQVEEVAEQYDIKLDPESDHNDVDEDAGEPKLKSSQQEHSPQAQHPQHLNKSPPPIYLPSSFLFQDPHSRAIAEDRRAHHTSRCCARIVTIWLCGHETDEWATCCEGAKGFGYAEQRPQVLCTKCDTECRLRNEDLDEDIEALEEEKMELIDEIAVMEERALGKDGGVEELTRGHRWGETHQRLEGVARRLSRLYEKRGRLENGDAYKPWTSSENGDPEVQATKRGRRGRHESNRSSPSSGLSIRGRGANRVVRSNGEGTFSYGDPDGVERKFMLGSEIYPH